MSIQSVIPAGRKPGSIMPFWFPRLRLRGMTVLSALFFLGAPVRAEVLTVFSDQGVPGTPAGFNPVITFSGGPAVFLGTSTAVTPPEGLTSFQTIDQTGAFAGWGIQFPKAQNLSRFNGGELRFWVYSSTGNVEVQMKDGSGNLQMDTSLDLLGWNAATMQNQWIFMRIGMKPVNLSSIQIPALFTANFNPSKTPATFYIDNVHFITATTAPNFTVTIKNRSDNATASQVSWTKPPAAWALADQYLSVETDSTVMSWGVQLYTNNTLPGANPRYTGLVSSFTQTPAGLVNTSDTTSLLPLAWTTRSDVSTITVVAADPNNSADPNSFQWLVAEDKAQVAVKNLNAAAFADADPFITTRNNVGIHFGQSPAEFGPADPPYRIYLEAGLGASLAKQTYQTSTLTLELFYL
jgi:hypothetical protein